MAAELGYLLLPGEGRGLAAGVQEGVTAWKKGSGGQAGAGGRRQEAAGVQEGVTAWNKGSGGQAGGGRRQEDKGQGSRNE